MQQSRRGFLGKTAGSAALMALNGLETARGYGANDTLQVGCIGTGGRCRRLMERLKMIPNVRITAVADVWDDHLQKGKDLAHDSAFTTKHFPELLSRNDVDAVVIGSPDHWHVPMTIAACEAGKDVYVEKPLTHDLSEGEIVQRAERDSKAIVQVGMQQRSMPHIQKAYEIVKSGGIGEIYKVHLTWNRNTTRWSRPDLKIDPNSVLWDKFLGNAPEQKFDPYRFRNWRWFWDFGGGIFTDLMVHWVDVAYWFLDLTEPALATAIGDHYKAKDLWETPDTVQCLLQYPDQHAQVYFEGTFVNARNRAMIEFMGSEGTVYIDRGRYEVHPDPHKKLNPSQMVIGKGPKGADFFEEVDGALYHLQNWVECIRTRKTPRAPVKAGIQAAAAAHFANQAYRNGKAIQPGQRAES